MTRKDLKLLVNNKFKETADNALSIDSLKAKLDNYSNKDGKISNDELAMFALTESIVFSKELILSILSEVLELDD